MAVRHGGGGGGGGLKALAAAVPHFVLGFVAMAALRTAGDAHTAGGGKVLGVLDAPRWKASADWLGGTLGTKYLLGAGLAAVGLSVNVEAFRGAGIKPFVVGGLGAGIVGGVGLATALALASLGQAAKA